MLNTDQKKTIRAFADLLLSEAREAVQSDHRLGTREWRRDVLVYALQSVQLAEQRSCVSEVMERLKRDLEMYV